MRKVFVFLCFLFCIFGCKADRFAKSNFAKNLSDELIDALDDTRPREGYLSMCEAVRRGAEWAWNDGRLTERYLTSQDPEILDAHLVEPVATYTVDNNSLIGVTYTVYAQDDLGNNVGDMVFTGGENAVGDDICIGEAWRNEHKSVLHTITKDEVKDLIEYQFPGETYTEPVLLDVGKDIVYSVCYGWYFACGDVGDETVVEKGNGEIREFILDPVIYNNTKPINFKGSLARKGGLSDEAMWEGLSELDGYWGLYTYLRSLREKKDSNGCYCKVVTKSPGAEDYNTSFQYKTKKFELK